MANHRQNGTSIRKQIVMSAPSRLFDKRYLSPKGARLILSAKTKKDKDAIWVKYGKNRYINNPDSHPLHAEGKRGLKTIYHT